jgi:NADH-quinone oxidoreductase subunit G
MRILPKLNDDINENWISDKTRYAFDGLRIQRLESIYVNKIGQNKRLDWKNSLKLFSDLIISKRFNQNTKFLIGELQGLNSIFFIKKFVEWLGFKNIQLGQQNSVLNINHYSNYRFNSLIKNIEKSDTILLIGCNPRFEGSSINTHIRQAVSRNNTQVFSIGSFFTPNYELKHIGSSHKTLVEVAEGKHLICKELRQAKNLLMIVGTDIFKTKSPFVFQKLVNDLGRHLYLHNYEWNGFNVLTPSLTEINAWECGLSFGSNSESNNSYAEKIEYENIFSINYHNSIENQKDINNKFIINFNSHLSSNDWLASYNFPITSTYEKNEFLTNTEGRIQKAFKSTTEPTHSRNLENIIQALIKINDEKNINHFTKEKFFEENPRLKRWQEGVPSGFTKFLHQDFKGGRLYLSYFRNVVDNFYMTDFLSQNSKIMAQAYKFMNNRSNFFDIK